MKKKYIAILLGITLGMTTLVGCSGTNTSESSTIQESQSVTGATERFSIFRTGKNHILHVASSQLSGTLLTKYPANRISYVALSASVWPYDPGNTIMKFKINLVCK